MWIVAAYSEYDHEPLQSSFFTGAGCRDQKKNTLYDDKDAHVAALY